MKYARKIFIYLNTTKKLTVILSCSVLLSILFPTACHAWGSEGHKLVALVAWQKMDPAKRKKIVDIAKKNKTFEQYFSSRMPDDVKSESEAIKDQWIFIQMATWPDLVRKSTYDRPLWHYVNEPIYLIPQEENHIDINVNLDKNYPDNTLDKKLNAYQAYKKNKGIAIASNTADSDRAIALCWIMHLAGDIHQPLHSSALFSEDIFPGGDHGGNHIVISGVDNLHSIWDHIPAKADTKFTKLVTLAKQLIQQNASAADGDFVSWAGESHEIAVKTAYDQAILKKVANGNIDDHGVVTVSITKSVFNAYLAKAKTTANARIVSAGVRLEKELTEILAAI